MKKLFVTGAAMALLVAVWSGCGGGDDASTISVLGSDTMVNLAQAWAEEYHEEYPGISVHVLGGGSGTGIKALIGGECDMANSSREMEPSEKRKVKANHGEEAKAHVVGYDALAIYVHKKNPLEEISIDQLAEIYGENGKITRWAQLGVPEDSPATGEIALVGRQNSSGTFFYFREAVFGEKRDYGARITSLSGSKDVVSHVARTPQAIGYSGMGYATDEVKMLKVAKSDGEPSVAPTTENAISGDYPITRPLRVYTVGEPEGLVKDYLAWILSAEGQQVVRETGYVPLDTVEESPEAETPAGNAGDGGESEADEVE